MTLNSWSFPIPTSLPPPPMCWDYRYMPLYIQFSLPFLFPSVMPGISVKKAHWGYSTPGILFWCLPYSWSVSANESIFLLLPAFLPDDWLPWGLCSWPCLHQVRCTSFYFVFHQLELHKTSLVSRDYCQKLQSPLLLGSVAFFIHLSADRYLM